MNKHGHPSAHQHRRKMQKQARKKHRQEISAQQDAAHQRKRTDQFRRQGLAKLGEATRALLAGAKGAGVDIQPADIHGKIGSDGKGELTVSDRIPKPDVARVVKYMKEHPEEIGSATAEELNAEPGWSVKNGAVLVGDPDNDVRPWAAKHNGEWLRTVQGARRSWASKTSAEIALRMHAGVNA